VIDPQDTHWPNEDEWLADMKEWRRKESMELKAAAR
jgi:hypothetical protein